MKHIINSLHGEERLRQHIRNKFSRESTIIKAAEAIVNMNFFSHKSFYARSINRAPKAQIKYNIVKESKSSNYCNKSRLKFKQEKKKIKKNTTPTSKIFIS